MLWIRAFIAAASLSGVLTLASTIDASAAEQVPPAKAVKQAEAKLKRLIKEGEDRPSVYEARMELVQALRSLDSCDTDERVERELGLLDAWLERTGIPVRLNPQLVYNEMGRAAQARAYCTEDEAQQKAHHEAALAAFARARETAKHNYDALNEAIILYNASSSAEALGDLPRAIALMEEACAIDREYALNENYAEDYRELVRLKDEKSGTETAPEAIDQHLAGLAEDTVRFSFKAVHGEQQRYRSEVRELSVAGGQRQEQKVEVQYSSSVAVKEDLVTISMQPGESKVNGREAQAIAAQSRDFKPEDLVARLLAQPLSYTVKTNGEFVGASGLDEVRRIVIAKTDEAFAAADATEQRERARRLVGQLLSDAVINRQIADEWTMAVAWWIDAALDVGDWYTLEVDAPQVLLPDSTLKYKYLFKANRRLACGPSDAKKSCVELIVEGRPDREQFADYLIAVMTQMAGPQPRKKTRWFRERLAEDGEVLERHVLVVEPGTLKTYRQFKSKTTYIAASEKGGSPKIELETTLAELLAPAPSATRAPAKPVRNVPPPKRRTT